MIPGTSTARQVPAWQTELAEAISDPAALIAALGLDDAWLAPAKAAAQLFPLRVPRGFVRRMCPGDPHDPLLRQILPLGEELSETPGFSHDPVGDIKAMAAPGVLAKYRGRALLTVTGACAVHCRYCFRRHFPYAEANPLLERLAQTLAYLAGDASLTEVILSGGDPLTLSDRRLAELIARLEDIAHLKRLRVHTRLPIVLPARVNEELLAWVGGTRLQAVFVVHANHANELDDAVRTALARLRAAGARLLNQSVLLRGVNDSVAALADLSEALFDAGVQPYYLHLLDRVQGAAHFEVDEASARRLMAGLAARLPGYLVPRLVREVAGAPAKVGVVF